MILRRETCRAGRALLGWSAEKMGENSGLSTSTIQSFEAGRTRDLSAEAQEAIIKALKVAGVDVLPDNGKGQGVQFAQNTPDPLRKPRGKPGPKSNG